MVFSLRPDLHENGGFRGKQASLESAGLWQLLETSEPFQPLPKGEPEAFTQVWVYRVMASSDAI